MSYGHDDVDDDEAFAERDREDPRADLGYKPPLKLEPAPHPTLERRGPARKVGTLFFTVVERETCAPDERGGPIGGTLVCREPSRGGCGRPAPTLHADPRSSHPARVICSRCEGRINAELMGGRR